MKYGPCEDSTNKLDDQHKKLCCSIANGDSNDKKIKNVKFKTEQVETIKINNTIISAALREMWPSSVADAGEDWGDLDLAILFTLLVKEKR